MKVTVCCGKLRVVVPCGDGLIDVAELTTRASTRCRKMLSKTADFDISFLKTGQDAILFPEDTVKDVLDDHDVVNAVVGGETVPCLESLLAVDKTSTPLQSNEPQSNSTDVANGAHGCLARGVMSDGLQSTTKLPLNSVPLPHLQVFHKPGVQHLNPSTVVSLDDSSAGVTSILSTAAMSSHVTPTSFQCSECARPFVSQEGLNEHMDHMHSKRKGLKEAQCEICHKILKNMDNLKKHMYIHTDKRPFECETCNKKFRSKSDLRVHYRIHTGEKPYHCQMPDCGKSFNDRSSYRRHVMAHDGVKRKRSKPTHADNGNDTGVLLLTELTNSTIASMATATDVSEVVISHANADPVHFSHGYDQPDNAMQSNQINT